MRECITTDLRRGSRQPRCGIIAAIMMKRKIDGATEQEVLGRELVRGTAVVPIVNLLKK